MRPVDRKSTRLNSSHANISYAVFCLKKKKHRRARRRQRDGSPSRAAGMARTTPQAALGRSHLPPARGPRSRVAVDRRRYFFFNDTATTEIYTLSLHDALPI